MPDNDNDNDNDNDRFSDAEKSLINFMNCIRPESKILMVQLDLVYSWLWTGKMSALGCFLIATELAVLSGSSRWPVVSVLVAAAAPICMIERLELLLGKRWQASFKFRRWAPSMIWKLHQIKPVA